MKYASRVGQVHVDGTPIFQNRDDQGAEEAVARVLERAWGCEVRSFGMLSPVDFYAVRDGRIVGVIEVKHRATGVGEYPTVFLNVRKWLALHLAAVGLGTCAVFVVQWTDGIRWITLDGLPHPLEVKVNGGCREEVKSISDVEPVFLVPVAAMRELRFTEEGF